MRAFAHMRTCSDAQNPPRKEGMDILHIMLVAVMAWLSVDFQLPGDRFASPALSAFRGVATQPQWSYLFLLAASIGSVGLVSRNPWVQRASVLVLSTAHTCIAVLLFDGTTQGGGIPVGAGTYGSIASAGYLLCLGHFVPCARRFFK